MKYYIDTNIAISILKSRKNKTMFEDYCISSFSLIELERVKVLENLSFSYLPFNLLEIKKIKINFEKLREVSLILLDKSYFADFVHLEISQKLGLTFLTRDKRLSKVLHIYPNTKII